MLFDKPSSRARGGESGGGGGGVGGYTTNFYTGRLRC